MKIESITEPDSATWDRVWEQCDHATYFHSREWAELWSTYTSGRYRVRPRLITFADGKTALLPLVRRRIARGLIKTYETGPVTTFGGWISTDGLTDEHARSAAAYVASQVKNVTWRVNPYDPHAAVVAEMATHDDTTHVLELARGFDAIFRTWSKGHRAAVKQARREGITVKTAEGVEEWRAYYGAYEDSVRRWGESASTVYGWPLFETLARSRSGNVRLWLAIRGENVAAGSLCFYARKHVVYWHGAAYEEYFKMRPVNLLIHDAVREACADGYRWFDFNPSGGLEGVRAFKRSFGAVELPCPVVRRETAILQALRNLRGRR